MKTMNFIPYTKFLIVTAAFSFIAVGCSDDPEPTASEPMGKVALDLNLSIAGEPAALNTKYTTSSGYTVDISKFRMYVSNIKAVTTSGKEVSVGDVSLLDMEGSEDNTFTIPAGDYESLSFGIGLTPALNNSDPSSFEDENALSNFQGMYWSMLKYQFVVIEGRVNSVNNPQTNDVLLSYHTGTDAVYKETELTYSFNISSSSTSTTMLMLNLDLNELMDGDAGDLDPITNSSTHSMPSQIPFTQRVMDNIKGGLFVEAVLLEE